MNLKKYKSWKNKLNDFAKEIESKKWASDIWLKTNLAIVLCKNDKFNSPEGPYIPDLINRKYRYIVECDGSIHNDLKIKEKDKKKDQYFKNKGFKVFRIEYKNKLQLNEVKEHLINLKFKKRKVVVIT